MLRRKLLHWSSAQLSLAGRVVVANNVLLASIWFVASSCMFSRSCLEQLRRLIRNFIWSGKDKDNARAKVAWKTLIQPKSKGGLGLIDPWQQSKALLSKFVVRSLRPDVGPWSLFLQECLQCCALCTGGPWKKDTRWFCEQSSRIPRFEGNVYKLINGILQSWREIREALMQLPPAPNEEQMRQPLIWNTFFSTLTGKLLGQQPWLGWGKIASGPAATWEQWQTFSQQSPNQQKQELEKIYGHKKMMSLLQQCRWKTNPTAPPLCWDGFFTRTGVLLGAQGKTSENMVFLTMQPSGNLQISEQCQDLSAFCISEKVRIIAYHNKNWVIDPSPDTLDTTWKIWAYMNSPIRRLSWDPGGVAWSDPLLSPDKQIPFFCYSAKLGRRILQSKTQAPFPATSFWESEGIPRTFLGEFWHAFWDSHQSNKILTFQWQLLHRALPIGMWLMKAKLPPHCPYGDNQIESQRHVLWDCDAAHQIWGRMLRICTSLFPDTTFTWGSLVWSVVEGPPTLYESPPESKAYMTCKSQVKCTKSKNKPAQNDPSTDVRWT